MRKIVYGTDWEVLTAKGCKELNIIPGVLAGETSRHNLIVINRLSKKRAQMRDKELWFLLPAK
jgi:hypothetical protein